MKKRDDTSTIFLNGFFTGLTLQLAVGPVFFFILNIALLRTIFDGFFAVIAVTIVDYIYIILAILGVGKLLEKEKIKNILGIGGAVLLVIFGVIMISSINKGETNSVFQIALPTNYFASFISAFLLTLSSPLTIVFWTGLFSAKAIENNYSRKQLRVFGLSAGLATIAFLGLSVVVFSFVRQSIPITVIKILNILVGVLLMGYGVMRGINYYSTLRRPQQD